MTFLPWLLIAMLVGIAWLFLNGMLAGRERNNRRSEPTLRGGATARTSNNEPASIPMATYAEVKAEFDLRFRLWREAGRRIVNRMQWLSAQNFDGMDVPELLAHTSAEERSNLAVVVGTAANSDPATIAHALRKAGSHGVASFLRGSDVPYEEVVRDVAIKLGAKNLPTSNAASELERHAVGAAVEQMLAKASPDERMAILEELAKNQTTTSNGLMTATGGLALANLSGFGLYIAASSSLAAITSAVGLTLPFAVYSGMSGILATVTGPLGWAALAVVAVVQLGGAEYKKTVPGVIAIASSRARLIVDRDSEISNLHDQRNLHDERGRRLQVLESFIANMEHNGIGQSVPRSSVPW